MMRKYLVGIAAVSLFATVHCNGGNSQKTATGKVYSVETVTKTAPGKAIDFTWKENGRTVTFSEYTKGKVVLLNIWATWCGPCKREVPDLVEIAAEMEEQGVMVFGVSVDGDDKKVTLVTNFVEKAGINYINIIDNLKISAAYGGIQSIPTSFIIDRSGNIVQKIVGMQSKSQFVMAIQKAN